MRKRTELPPLPTARPSLRMALRTKLEAEHTHPPVFRRPELALDFGDRHTERLNLALRLLASQQRAVQSRALTATLLVLTNIILAGLFTWLFLQAFTFFPQAPMLRLLLVVLCLAGLALMFLSLVSGLRALVYWWHQGSGTASLLAPQFGGGPGGPVEGLDADELRTAFLGSTRRDLLNGAVDAISRGAIGARTQAASLRYSVLFLLLAVGSLLLLVFLAGFGLL